ncbi:hypothetical protein CEUSTIGMA_g8421.t1 [Chlamydomonas eustigma]|uniref:U3 small nucleolar RNA-associated protein 18 homolog n=1 Tax=Chlamydomonas eustigma TaxID=1157962 RepID=A0A250XD51_9CHLO|nr:hypothetical protein CEUSTIGMA_g8421.t1 [Chlamydomonas eustigma]|eukprot:GAX80986.1 hypothetical protein CEUSTIGMA_g8421.t1 [Chlamydomonas eustigma]
MKDKRKYKTLKGDPATKASELESFLFGGIHVAASVFQQKKDEDDDFEVADMIRKSGDIQNAFIEDRRPAQHNLDEEDYSDDSEEGAGIDVEESSSEELGEDTVEEEGEEEQGLPATHGADTDTREDEKEEDHSMKRRRAEVGVPVSTSGSRRPAWNDPDDVRLKVNVADQARLRKLRSNEKQTILNGVQYEAALRKQHSILNPRTSWAKQKTASSTHQHTASLAIGYGAVGSDEETTEVAEGLDAASLATQAGWLLGNSRGSSSRRVRALPAGRLETSRMKDANQQDPQEAVVRSCEFHPSGELLMTAGLDKRIRIFQVDGVRNPRVQSVFLEDCPVQQAAFAKGGAEIIAVGRRPHFYVYDLAAGHVERVAGPSGFKLKSLESFAVTPGGDASCGPAGPLMAVLGDQGNIPLISLRSRQWITTLKMSGSVRSASFSADGNQLITGGGDGILYCWDMRTRRCMGQMVDCGNKDSAALALSRDNRYLATGSASGVVNVYRQDKCWSSTALSATEAVHSHEQKTMMLPGSLLRPLMPSPLKEVMNLTTTVDTLAFSPDAQILAMASRLKKDSMRLLHVPSMTVFSNWPTSRSPLHYVHSLAFSPNGGFLAVGNAKGRVLLYRLHHYTDA